MVEFIFKFPPSSSIISKPSPVYIYIQYFNQETRNDTEFQAQVFLEKQEWGGDVGERALIENQERSCFRSTRRTERTCNPEEAILVRQQELPSHNSLRKSIRPQYRLIGDGHRLPPLSAFLTNSLRIFYSSLLDRYCLFIPPLAGISFAKSQTRYYFAGINPQISNYYFQGELFIVFIIELRIVNCETILHVKL